MPSSATSRLRLLVILFFCLSSALWAQKDTGSIVGTITDPSGAVVAGAKVVITDLERGNNFETTTNQAGEFVASALHVGRYTVTVEHAGFKKAVSVPVDLDVQQRVAVNVALQVGALSQAVEVTTAAPLLETTPGPPGGTRCPL